jgi:hypothetical protein
VGRHAGRHPAALGLLIVTGCSCLFIALTVGVIIGGPLVRFDRRAAEALHVYASEAPCLTHFFRVVVGIPGSLAALALVSGACWSPWHSSCTDTGLLWRHGWSRF